MLIVGMHTAAWPEPLMRCPPGSLESQTLPPRTCLRGMLLGFTKFDPTCRAGLLARSGGGLAMPGSYSHSDVWASYQDTVHASGDMCMVPAMMKP